MFATYQWSLVSVCALGDGSFAKPSVGVLFFEPEVEPSMDGTLLETKGLNRIQ
jgi:hypothetical protein